MVLIRMQGSNSSSLKISLSSNCLGVSFKQPSLSQTDTTEIFSATFMIVGSALMLHKALRSSFARLLNFGRNINAYESLL